MEASWHREQLKLLLACALGVTAACSWLACGARTALDVPTEATTGAADAAISAIDGGVITPPCVDGGCAATSCAGSMPTPGTVLWQASLPDAGDAGSFAGPLAADPSGWTYFLGAPGRYPATYTLVAVDACGVLRWQADAVPTAYINNAQVSVVVSGAQVVVQWGAVDAFDRTTGAHLWNVSLQAVAIDAGDGKLAFDDGAEIGPTVAASDGTRYVELESSVGSWLLAISPAGAVSTVTRLQGTDGTITDMILDAAGNIDVLFNSVNGALVRSYSPAGTLLASGTFGCVQSFLGPLASGSSFLLMQTVGCALTFQGTPAFTLGNAEVSDGFSAMAVDGDDNVCAASAGPGLYGFDATGEQRWMATPTAYVLGGPLLGSGGVVFVMENSNGDSMNASVRLLALEADTGGILWERGFTAKEQPLGGFPILLTAAGQLVFASNGVVTAVAAGQGPSADAEWPTPHGGPDQRRAAHTR